VPDDGQDAERDDDEIHEIDKAAGLKIESGVTKSLDVLVVADINTESSKAKKARKYSIRMINESAFFELISS